MASFRLGPRPLPVPVSWEPKVGKFPGAGYTPEEVGSVTEGGFPVVGEGPVAATPNAREEPDVVTHRREGWDRGGHRGGDGQGRIVAILRDRGQGGRIKDRGGQDGGASHIAGAILPH